jgi:hypothetical protein
VHLESLRTRYPRAACFNEVWDDFQELYHDLPMRSRADVNTALTGRLARRLGITTPIRMASALDVGSATGDDRLIAICRQLSGDSQYLSGRGGSKYQDEVKFAEAGIPLRHTSFSHPRYAQGGADFVAGLSVLDAVLHLGWKAAAALVKP